MLHFLFVLLQTTADLPTNIWTVGGALGLFAGVIAYLFKLYDNSQEKRLTEMKQNFENQIKELRKDLDDEKLARRGLQDQINNSLNGQLSKNNSLLEKVEECLDKMKH